MRREWAAALLGLVFFLRGEFLRNSYFYHWSSLLLGPVLWTLLLLAPLVLATSPPSRPLPPPRPWAWLLFLLPGLSIWARPWPQHQAWLKGPGVVLEIGTALSLAAAGLVLIFLMRGTRRGEGTSWPATILAFLFLSQQCLAAALHAWSPARSDMLYVVDLGARTLLAGENPYIKGYGESPFTYYPGYWLGYLPGAWLDWDPRVLAILYGTAALALLGKLGGGLPGWSALGGAGLFLGNYLFTRDDLATPWTWLLAGLILALQKSSPWLAGAAWGWGLASREWFWLLTPFWLAWIFHSLPKAKAWTALGTSLLAALVVALPAILAASFSPEALETTTYRFPGQGEKHSGAGLLAMQRHGFAWVFFRLGLSRWILPACFATWALVLAFYLRKTRTLPEMAAWGALSVAVFQILCVPMEPYHFLFPAYLLLASTAMDEKPF